MGLPGGLSYMVEVTSFTLMAVFIARLGTTAAAAHQIAASLSAVLYMVPLSLSIACSARVSFWIGRGDLAQARRLVGMGLGLMASLAISLAALLWLLHNQLPSLFSRNPAWPELAGHAIGQQFLGSRHAGFDAGVRIFLRLAVAGGQAACGCCGRLKSWHLPTANRWQASAYKFNLRCKSA
jgi:hypothetical protein